MGGATCWPVIRALSRIPRSSGQSIHPHPLRSESPPSFGQPLAKFHRVIPLLKSFLLEAAVTVGQQEKARFFFTPVGLMDGDDVEK